MDWNKLSFGLRMAALKKARELIKKEQADIEERHPPITPLDSHVENHLTIPLEASAPVQETTVIVKNQTPIERAIQHLREKANGG